MVQAQNSNIADRDAVPHRPHNRPRYSAHEALAFMAVSIGRKGWGGRRERRAEGADDLGSEVSLFLPICGPLFFPAVGPRSGLLMTLAMADFLSVCWLYGLVVADYFFLFLLG